MRDFEFQVLEAGGRIGWIFAKRFWASEVRDMTSQGKTAKALWRDRLRGLGSGIFHFVAAVAFASTGALDWLICSLTLIFLWTAVKQLMRALSAHKRLPALREQELLEAVHNS